MRRDPPTWRKARIGPRDDHHVLRVGTDGFVDPRDGTVRDRVVVEAGEWCNVLALTPEGDAILVKQFRFGSERISLELPGGVVEPGEDPAHAAARELEEETGYRAETVEPVGWVWANPAHFTNRVHSFVAKGCRLVHDGTPEEGEDLTVELVPVADIPRLVRDGLITHSLNVAGLYLATLRGHL